MARIAGIDLPPHKHIDVSLTYIYGIGKQTSVNTLNKLKIPCDRKTKDLSEKEVESIRKEIEKYKVEGTLRLEVSNNIKRLISVNAYRGIRHKLGLPVRGQRTHTNARVRKGPRKHAVALKKKGKVGKKG
jgi:small subunit ribosomal protein S13